MKLLCSEQHTFGIQLFKVAQEGSFYCGTLSIRAAPLGVVWLGQKTRVASIVSLTSIGRKHDNSKRHANLPHLFQSTNSI